MTESPGLTADAEFEAWYRAHYRRIFASAYLVSGDRAACAEAVDEAFARAYERWSRVGRMESPAGLDMDGRAECVAGRSPARPPSSRRGRAPHALDGLVRIPFSRD
jgi:predicted RNA polymerase sigma factor